VGGDIKYGKCNKAHYDDIEAPYSGLSKFESKSQRVFPQYDNDNDYWQNGIIQKRTEPLVP
jgi:hypothetical protein